jgi:hypothetical protein
LSAYQNATEFAEKPVEDYDPDGAKISPKTTVYRFRLDYEEGEKTIPKLLQSYLDQPEVEATTALVFGVWGEPYQSTSEGIVTTLAQGASRLPHLQAVFFGDIIQEECEISWIQQSDLGRLLQAFPDLQELRIRGGDGLLLDFPGHGLRKLTIESGGLPVEVVRSIAKADLPNLEELTLWLGVEEYGANWSLHDLAPLILGDRLPKLRSLGLCNSEKQDEIAQAIATSPILQRLETLNLSMGNLGDKGGEALLSSLLVKRLQFLNLRHHYMSDLLMERFKALDLRVDVSEVQEPDSWGDGELHRYVEFSE